MSSPDRLQRHFLVVGVDGPGDGTTVAALLRTAAERLDATGLVDVQDVTFAASSETGRPSASLTIYYDRVERRRTDR